MVILKNLKRNVISSSLHEKNWLALYKKSLINFIFFGVLIFIGGIFIFPNDSGTQQAFYLMVLLPFILILPLALNVLPFSNKNFYLYLLFPTYMFISHFWANPDNVTRDWFFFFRQLICFYAFFLSLFLVSRCKQYAYPFILYFLLLVGFISCCISLIQHFVLYDNPFEVEFRSFTIVDIDKAGAIFSLHISFCISGLATLTKIKYYKLVRNVLLAAICLDLFAIYLTKTLGSWVIVFAALLTLILAMKKNRLESYCIFVSLGMLTIAIFFALLNFSIDERTVQIRVDLIYVALGQWTDNFILGQGLTYKDPIESERYARLLPHTHNMLMDLLRFGGLIGGVLLVIPVFYCFSNLWFFEKDKFKLTFLSSWLICGLLATSFYGQQPYVRPGSYMWFLFWMPVTLIFVNNALLKNTKSISSSSIQ